MPSSAMKLLKKGRITHTIVNTHITQIMDITVVT
jgi:hypothetical protein